MKTLFTICILVATCLGQGFGGKSGVGGKAGFGGGAPAGGATWTLVQSPHTLSCNGSGTGATQVVTCASAAALSFTAGNAVVFLVGIATSGGDSFTVTPTFSAAVDGGDTMVHCPAQLAIENIASNIGEQTDCAYVLSSGGIVAQTSSFSWTMTLGNGLSWFADLQVLELHRSTGTATFDACTTGSSCIATSASCATCAVPTYSISGTSDYVAQWINVGAGAVSSISNAAYVNPFTNDTANLDGAFAGALNQASVVAQNWIVSTGPVAMSSVAFK